MIDFTNHAVEKDIIYWLYFFFDSMINQMSMSKSSKYLEAELKTSNHINLLFSRDRDNMKSL